MSFTLIVTVGVRAIAAAIRNAGSKRALANAKSYELDPRSIELAKQGDPSWGTFRKRVWQNEAVYNRSAYSKEQLKRMLTGRAPKINEKSMQLHHGYGRANDMYTVVKFSPSRHAMFHQAFGYHVNTSWNYQSISSLFG